MSQAIFLAHLRSMQKQLDLIVQQHLSPLELRQYFLAAEFEKVKMPSLKETTRLFTEINRKLTHDAQNPFLWAQRGLTYQKHQQPHQAISDFTRALIYFDKLSTEHLTQQDAQEQLQRIKRSIHDISTTIATRLEQRFPQLLGHTPYKT